MTLKNVHYVFIKHNENKTSQNNRQNMIHLQIFTGKRMKDEKSF